MSGVVAVGKDRWSAQSWAYHWVMEFLIDRVTQEDAVTALREIDESNFKWVAVDDFSTEQQSEVLNLLAHDLIPDAKIRLARESPEWDLAIEQLNELARIASTNLPEPT